jgi:prepilin signal peptidase PulO-like enzyme (type II secretory pathway)
MEIKGLALLGYVLSFVAGWLAGAAGNWAADILPRWGTNAVDGAPGRRRFALWHYLTLGWYPFPRPAADGTTGRGICPHCGERRPWRAPLLELATIAAFLLAWQRFSGDPVKLLVTWAFAAYLLVVLVIDFEHRRVLNVMLIPAAAVALLASFLSGAPTPLSALLGGAIGFGIFFLIALVGRGKMGAGDVKLAGVIGLMIGSPQVLTALFVGILLGGAAALLLLVTRRAGRKSYIAYAPYLSLGALACLLQFVGR